ncbi:hypothetical protein BDV98DRAFT_589701 [Pterulicium gracile]|uniref:RlpA-like double-psi beta-barrel-protein domain-containing protein-containing protein n=1 Tax=Pterulicium gracile TaxID=1884261 RepID=A0A5C3QX70_9AGAR|nr:hypothetical protein BDV98DRAFT_589701 [Pterula gracilis]
MKITLALLFATFTSITTVLAVAVAAPPPGVPSYQGPPTKKLHEIREEAMAEMKNATLVRRDSYGDGTWYDVNVGYTACGWLFNNDAWVVAAGEFTAVYSSFMVDGNPNNSKICGRNIWLWGWYGTGPTDVTIVDKCMDCAYNDIDMAPAVYRYVVGDQGTGRRPIGWSWK